MDSRLQKFDVFSKIPHQNSQKRLDSTRRLEERSFLQLKQYKNEFIRTPSNTNTRQEQTKKLRIKIKPTDGKNQILSYSLSIQNIETLPNRSLDPKVIKLLAPNKRKTAQTSPKQLNTTRSHYNNYFAHHETKENNVIKNNRQGMLPYVGFQNKIVKSQFEANLQLYKKQKNIPIQVKLVDQDKIRKQFEQVRNNFIKSQTQFKVEPFRASKSKFHLRDSKTHQQPHNVNNNSVESQTNMDFEYLEDFQKYDKNNIHQLRDEVIKSH